MKTLRRLLGEFVIPATIAIVWTFYNISSSNRNATFQAVVNVFGPTFFLISWATGQFFRVQKQAHVENNLLSIEGRVTNLIANLEAHTRDFIGYSTGDGGVASLLPSIVSDETIELGIKNTSPYPVFDIRIELIDLDEPIDPDVGKYWTRHQRLIESLYPNRFMPNLFRFEMNQRDRLNINIFFGTRANAITQQIRVRKLSGRLVIANRTAIGEKVIERAVPDDFPGADPGDLDAVFA